MQNSVETRRKDTLASSHLKFSAFQKWEAAGRMGDFGNFLSVFAESPLLPCIPHRLFWLKNSDIVELSSCRKGFIMWLIL